MQKNNLILLATALLASSALSSCTKEEIKTTTKPETNMSGPKNLSRGGNYVMYGIFKENDWFSGCTPGSAPCMVVVRPVIGWITADSYTITPDVAAGDDKLEVDIYKATGIETRFYSQMEVTIEQNGDQSVAFTQ